MTDTLPIGLEAHIGALQLSVGTLSDEVKQLRKDLHRLQDDLNPTGTLTYSTADPSQNFVDMGGPVSGKWWQVRNLIVGGSDITTAPNGVAWLVISSSSMMQVNPPMYAVRDFSTATALPYKAQYGAHEIVVLDDQHMFVFITGGVNATQYCASAMVESFPQFVRTRQ
jgi:hypothetical protein